MKKILNILLLFLLAFFACVNGSLSVQANSEYPINEKYEYQVKLNSAQWKALGSHHEKTQVSQIPEDILVNMTTTALLDSILDYPLIVDLYLFDTIQKGFDFVKNDFNGLQEFVERADWKEVLINKYQSLEREYRDNEGVFKNYFFCSVLMEATTLNIALLSYQYVYTPNGTPVLVEIRGELLTQTEINNIDLWIASAYPNAYKLDSATTNYNCHSYAWYYKSTSNTKWMNSPAAYMTDGSYNQGNPVVGSKLHYTTADHSGIIHAITQNVQNPVIVVSKWGSCGLYIHYLNDCPYEGSVTIWN